MSSWDESLASLRDRLLIQVDAGKSETVLDASRVPGCGLVLAGSKSALVAAEADRERLAVPMLFDLQRYAGSGRQRGTCPFDLGALAAQRRAGVAAVLTDSGYIGEDDAESLRAVLTQTRELAEPVVAALPLHLSWLRRNRNMLLDEIAVANVPIALVLEDNNDPLGAKASLIGLVDVLRRATVPTLLLRCDVSALGALAFGAYAAAVGTRTGLRHLFPAKGGGGGAPDNVESAFLTRFLAFRKTDKIALAAAKMPDDPMWACDCNVCFGRSLDWMYSYRASVQEVRAHSIARLVGLRDNLVGLDPGPAREESWRAKCNSAVFVHEQVEEYGIFWEAPSAIRHWKDVASLPVASQPSS